MRFFVLVLVLLVALGCASRTVDLTRPTNETVELRFSHDLDYREYDRIKDYDRFPWQAKTYLSSLHHSIEGLFREVEQHSRTLNPAYAASIKELRQLVTEFSEILMSAKILN